MISVRCKKCGKEIELKDKDNRSEYKDILAEEMCVDCYGTIDHNTAEQKLLDKIFNEEG